MAKHKNPRYLYKQKTSERWWLQISIPDSLVSHYGTKRLQRSTRMPPQPQQSKSGTSFYARLN